MKQYVILTSVLALAACGGGSGGGGHSGTPGEIRPTITVEGFGADTIVNPNNANLTNMSSYTVDYGTSENATKLAMVNYVEDHLGSSKGLLSRAATRNSMQSREDGFTPEQFAAADAAIQEMKQVVYDMVVASESSATALRQYISQHKSYVVNAMKLANVAVTDESSVDEIATLFTDFIGSHSLTSENVLAFGDQFDTQFGMEKHRLNEVKLKDTGTDAFFKFTLDNTGRIASVDLMENPMAEYGTSWTSAGTHGHDVKIVINNSGVAESVSDQGLNPFGNDGEYRMGEAGVLNRTGNGNAFTNTLYHYDFSDLFETWSNSAVSEGDFADIEINSDKALTLAEAKQKLKDYIIEKINKKLHNQNGGEVDGAVAAFVAAANHYISAIDNLDEMPTAQTAAQTATMHGIGKDVQLKYSDFGYAQMVRNTPEGPESQYVTYVGGYDQRRMDVSTPDTNLLADNSTFTGTAIVTVEDHDENKIAHTESNHRALYQDTGAVLKYNIVSSGDKAVTHVAQHTLTMNNLTALEGTTGGNNDWYKVVVTGTENNPTMNITFDEAGKHIDSNYQFFKMNTTTGEIERNQADGVGVIEQIVKTNGSSNTIDMVNGTTSTVEGHHRLNGTASAEYYGQNPVDPTEATAGFWMDERYANDNNKIQHELSVYGAFGGQKNQQ